MACHAESLGAMVRSSDCKCSTMTCCFQFDVVYFLDDLVKETTCNVMVDHLQSRGTPRRQCTNHMKVRGTLSKMDVKSIGAQGVTVKRPQNCVPSPSAKSFCSLQYYAFAFDLTLITNFLLA